MAATMPAPPFVALFTPKLVTVLRERYGLADLRADIGAGLTVAVVALPLSMAIAIASGVTPDRGLYTAIVGGFCVSLLGGSRFQIGGPAGAFIVLVATTVAAHGLAGLLLAILLSGLILLAAGLLRLGTFIKYIPYPVTVGFTSGIAVVIFASQIRELLGLSLAGPEPGPFIPRLLALGAALPSVSVAALAMTALTIAAILTTRRLRPHWPACILAVLLVSVVAWAFGLPVETIGSRLGGIPHTLPMPHLPALSVAAIIAMLPAAFAFALLGGIESLLSAVVAGSMTGRRHRSNAKLVAQGVANIASSLFGGICVTGTIARTATNVRAGARGPVAGMLHAVFVLLFMLLAAPLAAYIPLAALASVLAVVCWNMIERHAIATLARASRGDVFMLLVTFLLVIFRDLTTGMLVGFSLGALLFLQRMAQAVKVDRPSLVVAEADVADTDAGRPRTAYDSALATDPDIAVYRISGAFFFGAAAAVGAAPDRIGQQPRALIIDVSGVPVLDSTAAATIEGFARGAGRRGAVVYVTGARPPIRRLLHAQGVCPPRVRFRGQIADAVAAARADLAGHSPIAGAPAVSASH